MTCSNDTDAHLQGKYKALVRTLPANVEGLHALGHALRSDFHCDRVSLFLKAERGTYVSVYAEGLEDMTLAVKPGEGLAGKAIQRREPILSNEAPYDPDALCRLRDHYSGYQTWTLLVAPIPGRLFGPEGAVQLINKLDGAFSTEDERRLVRVAEALRGLGRLCRCPSGNLWDPCLHRENLHAPSDQAVLADHGAR
jgi:hypothetical protein